MLSLSSVSMPYKNCGQEKKRKLYQILLERGGTTCFWCSLPFTEKWPFTIDHLVPRSKGGRNIPENLVLACNWCNNKRGDKSAQEFMHFIRNIWDGVREGCEVSPRNLKEQQNRLTNGVLGENNDQ